MRPLLLSSILLCLAACSTGCEAPKRANLYRLRLGETTRAQLLQDVGEPKISSVVNDGSNPRDLLFFDAYGGESPTNIEYVTGLYTELENDRLQAYLMTGALKINRQHFDSWAATVYGPGKITFDELRLRFGFPVGRALRGSRLLIGGQTFADNAIERAVWVDVSDQTKGWSNTPKETRFLAADLDQRGNVLQTKIIKLNR